MKMMHMALPIGENVLMGNDVPESNITLRQGLENFYFGYSHC